MAGVTTSFELARLRLRGWYALVAGGLLLVGVPLLEGAFLAPLGYIDAVNAVAAQRSFVPLVQWLALDPGPDIALHVVEAAPFLLVLALPGTLRRVLAAGGGRWSVVAAWLGQIGFACYAVALFVGLFSSLAAGSAAATATTAAQTRAVAESYANSFAIQNLLSHVLGGLLVALFILFTSVQVARTRGSRVLPDWLGFLGLFPAALLTASAFEFIGQPAQVDAPLAAPALALLALWFAGIGYFLSRLPAVPAE
jgi:uncharacterized membrane protein